MPLEDDRDRQESGPDPSGPGVIVSSAAETHGFGQLVASRDLGDPLKTALGYWGAAVGSWAVLYVMALVFSSTGWLKGSPLEILLAGVVFVLAFGGLAGFVAGTLLFLPRNPLPFYCALCFASAGSLPEWRRAAHDRAGAAGLVRLRERLRGADR